MTDYAWPDDLVPYQVSFYLQPHTGGTESPFSRATKVYALSAPRWICKLSFRGGYNGIANQGAFGPRLDAMVAKLKGRQNRVTLHDWRRPAMRSPLWPATPGNATAATGATAIVLTGLVPGTTVYAGDYIGGDGRPHIITDDAIADGSGNAAVNFEPPLIAQIDADAAVFGNPTGLFRLTDDDAGANDTEVGGVTVITLSFVEDYAPEPLPREWRPVANNCITPCWVSQPVENDAFVEMHVRSDHYATENLSSIKIVHSSFLLTLNDGGTLTETDRTSGQLLKSLNQIVQVEYPEGVLHATATYGGSTTGTLVPLTNLTSDEVVVSIPAGGRFWIRRTVWNTDGSGWVNIPVANPGPSNGDLNNFVTFATSASARDPASLTNWTNENNMTDQVSPPSAIIQSTTNKAVAIIGDSRNAGGANDIYIGKPKSDVGEIAPVLSSLGIGYVNISAGNDRASKFVASHTLRAELASYASDIIVAYGVNDQGVGESLATFEGYLTTMAGYFAGKTMHLITLPPWSTSSGNGFTDEVNQTPNAGAQAFRIPHNDNVRTGAVSGYTGTYFEFADAAETARDSGIWKLVSGQPATVDGTHEYTRRNVQNITDVDMSALS